MKATSKENTVNDYQDSEPSKKEELLGKLIEAYEKLPREKREILLALVEGRAKRKGKSA